MKILAASLFCCNFALKFLKTSYEQQRLYRKTIKNPVLGYGQRCG